MMQFLLDHWNHVAAVVGVVALLAWVFWPSLAKLRIPAIGVGGEDTDVADLQALRRMAKRYEHCPEGKAAVDTLYKHFFHQHEAPHA